jgi:hypothetical protein
MLNPKFTAADGLETSGEYASHDEGSVRSADNGAPVTSFARTGAPGMDAVTTVANTRVARLADLHEDRFRDLLLPGGAGTLRPLVLRTQCVLSVCTTHPEAGQSDFLFAGLVDRVIARPRVVAGESARPEVRELVQSGDVAMADLDPGPTVQVTLRLRYALVQGMRLLYSGRGLADNPAALLGAREYEQLRRWGLFRLHRERCAHVRLAPVSGPEGLSVLELFRWRLDAPRAEFNESGGLVQLCLSGEALHAPFLAEQADPVFGLCGQRRALVCAQAPAQPT